MCDICDGMSYDESRSRALDMIEQYGWMVQYVEPPPHGVGWGYTIGLVEHFGHPELVMVNTEADSTYRLLNAWANAIAGGSILVPGDPGAAEHLGAADVSVHHVHPAHLRAETFARWHDIYRTWPTPPRLQVLEVALGPSWFCSGHGEEAGPRLRGPHLPARNVNRAERRAANRPSRGRRPTGRHPGNGRRRLR